MFPDKERETFEFRDQEKTSLESVHFLILKCSGKTTFPEPFMVRTCKISRGGKWSGNTQETLRVSGNRRFRTVSGSKPEWPIRSDCSVLPWRPNERAASLDDCVRSYGGRQNRCCEDESPEMEGSQGNWRRGWRCMLHPSKHIEP